MLTVRGSFMIGVSVYGLGMALIMSLDSLALICLAFLLWIWIEWLHFAAMENQTAAFINSIRRQIDGQDESRITLVADRKYEVAIFADPDLIRSGYRITLTDVVPDIVKVEGQSQAIVDSGFRIRLIPTGKGPKLRQIYQAESPISGKVAFPGIQLELSDYAGFFRSEQFAPVYQEVTVLPYLVRPQTTVSVLKHNNLQRHLGHHRHRSSGLSSELHGIRDYRAGDPPRTIAWKPTARLGKLMTSEFENEVPVRATVLVDLAAYQFQGRPGPTAGDRAISSTASIAKLLLADRDPIAMMLIDDHGATRLDHGNGERHLARLIQYLLKAADPHPPLDHFHLVDLMQVVFENASRRFPNLFDERYNRGRSPFRFFDRHSNRSRMRRALGVVLAHLFQRPYGYALQLQFDDNEFRQACLDYVRKYSVVSSATTVAIDPPYQDVGQWLRARNKMTLKLCEHLTQARSRAKDNELFILIAPEPHDLLGCEMIEAAIKQTVAARHRVLYVAPERPKIQHLVHDELAAKIVLRHNASLHRTAESVLGERLKLIDTGFARIDDPQLLSLVAAEIGLLQSAAQRGNGMRRAMR